MPRALRTNRCGARNEDRCQSGIIVFGWWRNAGTHIVIAVFWFMRWSNATWKTIAPDLHWLTPHPGSPTSPPNQQQS
ncbi:MAG: hypothetical protein MUD01_02620 [Chloroflexaceae bacterium]|jgi:hypothetical protein|nr:hypothetical protein [Chloroflexaceae bacterium]